MGTRDGPTPYQVVASRCYIFLSRVNHRSFQSCIGCVFAYIFPSLVRIGSQLTSAIIQPSSNLQKHNPNTARCLFIIISCRFGIVIERPFYPPLIVVVILSRPCTLHCEQCIDYLSCLARFPFLHRTILYIRLPPLSLVILVFVRN